MYYNTNTSYLDFLLAFEKMFTNKQNVLPLIYGFNFYVNGVYSTPLTDLFRMYEDNLEDIHGTEKTKTLTDDGTIGIINKYIYNAGGSLINALEKLRVFLLDRAGTHNIIFNPMQNLYTETLKTAVNVLPDSNPVVGNGQQNPPANGIAAGEMNNNPNVTPKKKKSFWRYLSFLVHKPKTKTV